jgi:hypothetical protein
MWLAVGVGALARDSSTLSRSIRSGAKETGVSVLSQQQLVKEKKEGRGRRGIKGSKMHPMVL